MRMASGSPSNGITEATGPKIASREMRAEGGAIDGSLPIRVIKGNVGGLAAEFEWDARECVRGALADGFSDGRAGREGDFVHAGMRAEPGARRFAKAVHDVDASGREA